ncbi:MAG: HAD family hydrolase [Ignavibacteriaceae bacterium]
MKINHICFDLDGTIMDSFPTIFSTTKKVLSELKIPGQLDEKIFASKVGKHFIEIFSEMNIQLDNFEEFIAIYKQHYFEFIDDSVLFPGVTELLNLLNEQQIRVSLLTTKAQEQADKIIDHFSLRNYFSFVMGRRNNIPHKPSPASLLHICNEIGIPPSETLMTGDTEIDIQCGKSAGAFTCAVDFGYRTREELIHENPDFIISSFDELPVIINLI